MALTEAQKQKKLEKETNQIDIATIVLIVVILVVCVIIGVAVGKLLFDLAMANA